MRVHHKCQTSGGQCPPYILIGVTGAGDVQTLRPFNTKKDNATKKKH
jgi:hypothetical protein